MRIWVKYILLLVITGRLLYSQSVITLNDNNIPNNSLNRSAAINQDQQTKMNNNGSKSIDEDMQMKIIKNFHDLMPKPVVQQKPTFNIVASFIENIQFGGWWNKYAIINFTPNINIKPFGFISIYANQNLSCFVPIDGIKEHFEFLCVQGASILAIDNSFKLPFDQSRIVPAVVAFALKNIVMSVVMNTLNNNSPNRLYSYRSYFYSMNITF
jgi:hypothetical protein